MLTSTCFPQKLLSHHQANAECRVQGPSNQTWIQVQLRLKNLDSELFRSGSVWTEVSLLSQVSRLYRWYPLFHGGLCCSHHCIHSPGTGASVLHGPLTSKCQSDWRDKLIISLFLQTLSFSDETKDEINLALLDDVAWCQIQKLSVRKWMPSQEMWHLCSLL